MKRIFSLVLLVGALLGLFGQGVALAAMPAVQGAAVASSMTDAECMEMMQDDPAEAPCKGPTLDCIAAMGCTVPMTLAEPPQSLMAPLVGQGLRGTAISPRLAGRAVAPEPEPPALLI